MLPGTTSRGSMKQDIVNVARVIGLLCLVVGLFLLVERPSQERRADAERGARAWADRLGLRVTGVECSTWGACTIAPEGQA